MGNFHPPALRVLQRRLGLADSGTGQLCLTKIVVLTEVELRARLNVVVERHARRPPEPCEDLEMLQRRRHPARG